MRAFFDTSVLVAALVHNHPMNDPSATILEGRTPEDSMCAAHNLAETYCTLTKIPARPRISPGRAAIQVGELLNRLSVVTLGAEQYLAAIQGAPEFDVRGGATYDFLIARTALHAGADAIYTWNQKHFTRFGGEIAALVRSPSEGA